MSGRDVVRLASRHGLVGRRRLITPGGWGHLVYVYPRQGHTLATTHYRVDTHRTLGSRSAWITARTGRWASSSTHHFSDLGSRISIVGIRSPSISHLTVIYRTLLRSPHVAPERPRTRSQPRIDRWINAVRQTGGLTRREHSKLIDFKTLLSLRFR
jgi:hypothetical protein